MGSTKKKVAVTEDKLLSSESLVRKKTAFLNASDAKFHTADGKVERLGADLRDALARQGQAETDLATVTTSFENQKIEVLELREKLKQSESTSMRVNDELASCKEELRKTEGNMAKL